MNHKKSKSQLYSAEGDKRKVLIQEAKDYFSHPKLNVLNNRGKNKKRTEGAGVTTIQYRRML